MWLKNFRNQEKSKEKCEKGAVVIEAALSLSVFMFFIVTILSIVNICIVQQKVGLALNATAKEIAQYAYIYSLSGLNGIQETNYEGAASAREDIGTVVDGLSKLNGSISAFAEGDASFDETYNDVAEAGETVFDTATGAAKEGSAWVMSFLRLLGNESAEYMKSQFGGVIVKGLIQKNLVSYDGGSADEYLKQKGVIDGIEGIKFDDSVFMLNGSNDIILIADYDVHVIKLLNHEITLHFRQAAVTRAWEASPLESGIAGGEEGEKEEEPAKPGTEPSGEEETDLDTEPGGDSETEKPGDESKGDDKTVSGGGTGIVVVPGEPGEEETEATSKEIRQKMIDKYGEGAILEIEKHKDTSNYTEDDWEYQIYLYTVSEPEDDGSGAKGLIGHDFEDYLTDVIGGSGSFSVGGRDFDGGVDNRWWEAKSGNYWKMLEENPSKLAKFKSDMGDRLRIATENGATYELFSNTPIPESIKQWLTKKGIPFTEFLD